MRPPSVPTRVERPQSGPEPVPVGPRPAAGRPASGATPRPGPAGPNAPVAPQGPPSPARKPPPPPKPTYRDEEPDEDESPTAMFVHPMPMKYDPNGPPVASVDEPRPATPAAGLPARAPGPAAGAPPPAPATHNLVDGDDDFSEPPTAIHMPAFRPEDVPGAPPLPAEFRGAGPMPSPIGAPIPAAGAPHAAQQAPAAHAPAPVPQQAAGPRGFVPPGVAPQQAAPAAYAPAPMGAPAQPMQQTPYELGPSASHPSRVASAGAGYAQTPPPIDPDAAPLWLKAVALSTVVSALTVLGVLGWMVARRF